MNASNAKDYLPLVQALSEGKSIQFNYGSWDDPKWREVDNFYDTNPAECYRIKPEPREIWVNEWEPAGKVVFDSAAEAQEHARRYGIGHSTTRYREVIE